MGGKPLIRKPADNRTVSKPLIRKPSDDMAIRKQQEEFMASLVQAQLGGKDERPYAVRVAEVTWPYPLFMPERGRS